MYCAWPRRSGGQRLFHRHASTSRIVFLRRATDSAILRSTVLLLLLGLQPTVALAQVRDADPPAERVRHHDKLRVGSGIRAEAQVVDHPPRINPEMAADRASIASANFDASYYHLDLDVRLDPEYLYGRTRIVGRVTSGSLPTLVLDFSLQMQVDSVLDASGNRLSFTHSTNALQIDLGTAAAPGGAVEVEVHYQGLPRVGDFGIFRFGELGNGNPFVWSLSEPYGAREWWPCKDHPSDKADSVRVTTTIPSPLQVASNGVEISRNEHPDGRRTFDWMSRYPIATYLVSIAAGVYQGHWQTYVRPDSLAGDMGPLELPIVHFEYEGTTVFEGSVPGTGWRHVLEVLPLLEYWFGAYPFPEEKYGHAHVTFGGGMEHQTISSMGGSGLGLIVHELAHQWYGDLITMATWPHLWLNEGFANFSELLWWDYVRDEFPETHDQVFDIYFNRALDAIGTLVVEDTLSIDRLFDSRLVYAKGGMVLHMLRKMAGDQVFREILTDYAASDALRYGNATTADFRAVAEDVSGLDLEAFFRQWVTEGTGEPVYHLTWDSEEAEGGFDVQMHVAQVQEPPESNVDVFVMPITIAVYTPNGTEHFRVENDRRQQSYAFRLAAQPDSVRLDPNRDLLRRIATEPVAVEPDPKSPERLLLARLFPNPAGDVVHLELEREPRIPVRIVLYDLVGRRVGDWESLRRNVELDVEGLASGLYFLRIEGDDAVETRIISIVR